MNLSSKAFLCLESGLCFSGTSLGEKRDSVGEVIFNTSHSGYEQIATDPSYHNQILVSSFPQQGNYGVSEVESDHVWIQGFLCLQIQNTQRECRWVEFLKTHKVPILTDLDTRKLVLELRDKGSLLGAIICDSNETQARKKALKKIDEFRKKDSFWIQEVSRKKIEDMKGEREDGKKIAVLDFGCKKNIIRTLKQHVKCLRIFPCQSSFDEIEQWNPDGILLSNGPGDPQKVPLQVIQVIQTLLKKGFFIFGICMGHQLLARALGGKNDKLKFGHRGSNHPIEDKILNQIYMSAQNHGYVVNEKSLPQSVEISHVNLNDHTISGLKGDGFLSVQFHPEASPGPYDSKHLFKYFVDQL